MTPILSKSKYMSGLQCPRLLWFQVNSPEEIPETDEETQFVFDQGHEVGNFAKRLFPDGIEIPHDKNFVNATRRIIPLRKPIFEGAFSFNGGFAKVDILNPVDKGRWDLIEVKSSTEVKDEHLEDVAFQKYVIEGSGLKIRNCILMHVNNGYVRKGDIDPTQLLTQEEISDRVAMRLSLVEANLTEMQKVIATKKPPEMSIGSHCNDPYDCPLAEKCWSYLPDHNVTQLYRGKQKGYELIDQGILQIRDIPIGTELSEKQEIQIEAIRNGKAFVNKEQIRTFLRRIEYPVYCLDFETLNVAIPPFAGARPYQKIPFQFSIHIIPAVRVEPKSHSFLAEGRDNFANDIIQALKVIEPKGTILSYNKSFEKQVLKSLEDLYPREKEWLGNLIPRMKDLMEPFRSFSYYHPEQCGSCSFKEILPALTGQSYEGMEIKEGGTASLKYYMTHFRDCEEEEKQKMRRALLEYCNLDTEGMVEILRELDRICS